MFIARYASRMVCDAIQMSKIAVGRALREAGLTLDKRGSEYSNDIAYMEHFNRHRNILPIFNQSP